MKKTYLEPETKLYAMCVEGYLLNHTNVTAGMKSPEEGGSPVTRESNPGESNPSNPFDSSSPAKEEITWSFDD